MRLALGLSLTDLGIGALGWIAWTSVLPQDVPGAQRKGKDSEEVGGDSILLDFLALLSILYVFIDLQLNQTNLDID